MSLTSRTYTTKGKQLSFYGSLQVVSLYHLIVTHTFRLNFTLFTRLYYCLTVLIRHVDIAWSSNCLSTDCHKAFETMNPNQANPVNFSLNMERN